MEFTFRGFETDDGWADWHGTNYAVEGGALRIATADAPAYGSPAQLPIEFEPVDLALDECGDLYLLAPSGEIHRYDPVLGTVARLPCTWGFSEGGSATALAVTRRSIVVAAEDGRVRAFARRLHQPRWTVTEPFDAPIALASTTGTVLVLDESSGGGDSGGVLALDDRGGVEQVITGLTAPRDIAVDPHGRAFILTGSKGSQAIHRYDTDYRPAASIPVPEPLAATCLDVDVGPVIGVGPSTDGELSLFRHRSGEFERLGGISAPTAAIAMWAGGIRGRPNGLYAVAGDPGRVVFLEQATQHRRNPVTNGYDAQAVTRIDSGEPGTEWHRITTDLSAPDTGTQVRFRYFATDDAGLEYSDEYLSLETVDGIGPTFAGRLREAGIRGLTELIERDPKTIAKAVSTEVLDVSTDRVAEWMDQGRALRGDRDEPISLQAIDGIGPTFSGRLHDAGIDTVTGLLEHTPAAIARVVSAGVYDIPPSRAEHWIAATKRRLADRGDVRGADWTTMDRANPHDALLTGAEGRYLWVEFDLVGEQFATPRIDSFRAYFPRQSYLRHLPAVYQDNESSAAFLERFLSIFESVFTDIDEEIEAATRYLDPDGIPAEYLAWLGDWVALEAGETWPEPAHRDLIARAPALFKQRGTRAGLLEILTLYLSHIPADGNRHRPHRASRPSISTATTGNGAAPSDTRPREDAAGAGESAESDSDPSASKDPPPVYLIEHSDLDCIDDPAVREIYERLIPCPQCFLVLVRSWFDAETVQTVDRIVERERPAHAVGQTVGMRPWIQLGGNSYLGINTALPNRDLVIEEASLGKDSVLAEREADGQLGTSSRLGTDTTIS